MLGLVSPVITINYQYKLILSHSICLVLNDLVDFAVMMLYVLTAVDYGSAYENVQQLYNTTLYYDILCGDS